MYLFNIILKLLSYNLLNIRLFTTETLPKNSEKPYSGILVYCVFILNT